MNAFVIITNRKNLSNVIQDYFHTLSPINYNILVFLSYGLDENTYDEIVRDLKEKNKAKNKIENYFIFADFGDALLTAKKIEKNLDNVIFCKGPIIESGFLTFELINANAPIESITLSLDRIMKK